MPVPLSLGSNTEATTIIHFVVPSPFLEMSYEHKCTSILLFFLPSNSYIPNALFMFCFLNLIYLGDYVLSPLHSDHLGLFPINRYTSAPFLTDA